MRILQRTLAMLCILLSGAGILVCVGGVVAVWVVRAPVTEATTRVLGRVEDALGITTRGLNDLNAALDKAEKNLGEFKAASATAGGGGDNLALRFVALGLRQDTAPQLRKVRETLLGVSTAADVINSLLADVNEVPLVRVSSLDAEQLRGVTAKLSEVGGMAQQLGDLLDSGRSMDGEAAADRMRTRLAEMRASVREFETRLVEIQDRVTTLRSRAPHSIDVGAVVLSLVLLWLAVAQISLLIHAWGWLRTGPATSHP